MSHTNSASVVPTRILVPIDFSPSSHLALEAATELAEKFGASIYLLHVVPEFPNVTLPETISGNAILEAAKKSATEHFAVSKAALEPKGINVTTNVVVGADVAGTIIDTVEQEQVDLVIFTTHGLSGWYPQVFGSIAEKLVRLIHCPVLLLRTPKPQSSTTVKVGRMMEWW